MQTPTKEVGDNSDLFRRNLFYAIGGDPGKRMQGAENMPLLTVSIDGLTGWDYTIKRIVYQPPETGIGANGCCYEFR